MSEKSDSPKEKKDKPALFRRLSRAAFSKSEISKSDKSSSSTSQSTVKLPQDRPVEKWSKQQMLYWLDANKLRYLKWHYVDEEERKAIKTKYVNDNTKMWAKHPIRTNLLVLDKAPAKTLISLATIPPDSDLKKIWMHEDFVPDLVYMLPLVMPASAFLEELEKRYKYIPEHVKDSDDEDDDEPETKPVEAPSVIEVLRTWVFEDGHHELTSDPELYKRFKKFCDKGVSKEHAAAAKELRKKIDAMLKDAKKPTKSDSVQLDAPAAILPKTFKDVTLLDLDALEVARQMTLMEEALFRPIRPREFHKQAWNKAGRELNAPHLNKLTLHANKMINWVTTEILKVPETVERAQLITRFIKIALALRTLNNYNGVMEILSSLHSSAISRLKLSWNEVSKKDKDSFEELTTLMSNMGNFKSYRELYAAIPDDEPCIPFLPVFLTDCTYLDDVGSDKTEDGWVNWSKLEGLARKIRDILRPGKRPYNLHPVPQIQKFIEEAEAWNDTKALYAISQLSEAKAPVGGAEASGFAGAARRAGGSAAVRRGMGARRSTVSNLQAFRQAATGSTGTPVAGAASDAPKEDPYALSEREWKILSAGATLKKFEANQVISDEGEDDRFMYRVQSGKVKVERIPPLEPEAGYVTLVTASEKDLIGEIALLKTHRVALCGRIVAVEPSEIYQLGVEFVLKICESESDLSEKLHRILALKLARRLRSINANKGKSASSQDSATNSRPLSSQGVAPTVASASMPDEDEAKKADEKFVKKFGLPSTEVIIRAIDCSLKQKVVSHGTMFVSQAYVCYSATVFGLKKKEVIPFFSISKIENIANGKVIQITTDNDKLYMFSSFDEPTETIDFLNTLWSNVSERQRSSKSESATEKGSSSATSSPAPSGSGKKRVKAHSRGASDEDNSRLHSRSASSLDSIPETGDVDDIATSVDSKDGEPSSPDVSVRSLVDSSGPRDRSGSESGMHLNLPARDRADSLASSSPRAAEQSKLTGLRARYDLTEEDWENILKGASVTTYSKDQPVITEGDKMQRIYQVGRGSCRIEKALLSDDKQKLVLGKFVKDDGVFGEISFLEGGAATASVVADEEETAVHIIEGYFLDVLFQRTPGLAGRFYHYLASLLAKRVAQREGSVAMPSSPRPNKPPPPVPLSPPALAASSEASATTDSESTTSEGSAPLPSPSSSKIIIPPRSPEKRRSSHGSQDGLSDVKLRIRRPSESDDSDSQSADVVELVLGEKKKKRSSQKSLKRKSLKVSDSTGSIPSSSSEHLSTVHENHHNEHHLSAPSPHHSSEHSSSTPENDDEDSSSSKEKRGVKKMQKRNSKRSASMAPPMSKIE